MSDFSPIDPNTIKVGDPITRNLWVNIKDNFDNHELRINNLSISGGNVFIYNQLVSFIGYSSSNPNVMYYAARTSFSINEFRAQLAAKNLTIEGILSFDLQKSPDTNDINFTSILSTELSFNFSTDAEHTIKTAAINSAVNDILAGEVIRVKVTSIPVSIYGQPFSGNILLSIGAA